MEAFKNAVPGWGPGSVGFTCTQAPGSVVGPRVNQSVSQSNNQSKQTNNQPTWKVVVYVVHACNPAPRRLRQGIAVNSRWTWTTQQDTVSEKRKKR